MKTTFETFQPLAKYTQNQLMQKEASCFNGEVKVVKYKITTEEVEEPIEVIHRRIQKLWDECDNMHHWRPLKEAANKYNYVLKSEAGNLTKLKKK